jgi:hypothetical protein
MSDMTCDTLKVVAPVTDSNPKGYIVINALDFSEDTHTMFEVDGQVTIPADEPIAPVAPVAPVAPEPVMLPVAELAPVAVPDLVDTVQAETKAPWLQ